MNHLNRHQRRQLPDRPTAERLHNMQQIKLLNRLNNYREIKDIIKESRTIKQINAKLDERITVTVALINELNKMEDK